MTKKHFIALADFLRIRTLTPNNGGSFTESQIEQLADFCQSQNPQFNRKRWLGYIAGSSGNNGGVRKAKRAAAEMPENIEPLACPRSISGS